MQTWEHQYTNPMLCNKKKKKGSVLRRDNGGIAVVIKQPSERMIICIINSFASYSPDYSNICLEKCNQTVKKNSIVHLSMPYFAEPTVQNPNTLS